MQEAITLASEECIIGNYRSALNLLRPLLRQAKALPDVEYVVTRLLSISYSALDQPKIALPHTQRYVALAQELYGPGSVKYAKALKALCAVHQGLQDYPEARRVINQTLAIMEDSGNAQTEEYGSMVLMQALLDIYEKRYDEALILCNKAKPLLSHHKESNDYSVLLNNMACCHLKREEWNDALACFKECLGYSYKRYGPDHREYASLLDNLAEAYTNLKQYEEAIPCFEQALAIEERLLGKYHRCPVHIRNRLADARVKAKHPQRYLIDVGHDYRMCNQCSHVEEHMSKCDGCSRVWYCNRECQLLHWPTHKLQCNVCQNCSKVLNTVKRCGCCKEAKYCDAVCQDICWHQHKLECVRRDK